MPYKNSYGKWIIPAGEVGQYAICPESWRLKMIRRVERALPEEQAQGEVKHEEWSSEVDKAFHLRQGLQLIIAFAVTMICFVLLQ